MCHCRAGVFDDGGGGGLVCGADGGHEVCARVCFCFVFESFFRLRVQVADAFVGCHGLEVG